MKKFIAFLMVAGMLAVLTGCHSETVRGVGRDIEGAGESMQK